MSPQSAGNVAPWPSMTLLGGLVPVKSSLSSDRAIMNNPRTDRLRPLGPTCPRRTPAAQRASSHTTSGGQETDRPAVESSVNDDELYLSSLPVIDDITGQVCRRHRLSATEADDFRSDVRVHFYDRHCEPLRRFEGRSTLATYLTVAIQRLFLDYRNRTWGRWRPSAEAKRLGPVGMLIERLIIRDGWSAEQAAELLRVNHGVAFDAQLSTLCDALTRRTVVRQFVSDVEVAEIESPAPGSDVNVVRSEQDFLAQRVRRALTRARQTLNPEDQLILKMRFEDSVSVANIARAMHLNQKRLYRIIERLLARLGQCLDAEGISRSDVRTLFGEGILDWSRGSESGGDARCEETDGSRKDGGDDARDGETGVQKPVDGSGVSRPVDGGPGRRRTPTARGPWLQKR
jgi:RNA polymerase sigma factor (sigma-70 family)